MKKLITASMLLFALALVIATSCRRGPKIPPTNTVFYIGQSCGNGEVTISINGQAKSISKVFSGSAPTCGAANTASFSLTAGTYDYTVKDNAGNRSGTLTVTEGVCNSVKVTCDSFSTNIRNVIEQKYIDSLKKWGMVINAGQNPPTNLNGVYFVSPMTLSHAYGPNDNYYVGEVISDYKYKLYDQQGDLINVSKKSIGASDTAIGLAGYISGAGNSFTVFGRVSGVASSVPYTEIFIISGIMTSTGIKDFQYGFIMESKTGDDFNNVLMPVGKARIFYDSDYLSGISTSFRPSLSGSNVGSQKSTGGSTK
jgi:hypothetical protein